MNAINSKLTFLFLFLSITFVFANDKNPEPVTWEQNVKGLLYDDSVKIRDGSDFMVLETPYRALDAAIVNDS